VSTTSSTARSSSTTSTRAAGEAGWRGSFSLGERFDSPVTTYYLLLGATAMLVVIGLVMVLSASSVTSLRDTNSSYTVFLGQLRFAVLGVIGAFVASRIPVRLWKRLGVFVLGGSLMLQALVFTPLGVDVMGNRNWIAVGPVQVQPSEFAKIGLVLFGAAVLARKRRRLAEYVHAFVPLVFPAGVLLLLLVLGGHDLGTALVLIAIIGGMLFASGVPTRVFVFAGAAAVVLAAGMVLTSGNRMGRISTWLAGACADPNGTGFQTCHGIYALADGGWWGVGLGASREKWQWLPEAHNDFIFSIIGEELGLPGTFVVMGLFAALAFACYRLVSRTDDFFIRVASAGVMVWILVQAIINIGSVIGALPVVGVPLPLVSAGGSALVTTLVGLGMLISFARNEPGCAEALSTRVGVVSRSLAVLPARRRRSRG
jgi:cell division protein FtsW